MVMICKTCGKEMWGWVFMIKGQVNHFGMVN